MGQTCQSSDTKANSQFSDGDAFLDNTDPLETNIQHQSSRLQCDSKQTEKLLEKIANKIIAENSLYKDQSTPSASVTLKSKTQKQQIQCVYKRPYNFLSGCEKGKIYKLFQHERDPSLIIVQNQVLQFFGIFLCFLESKPTEISKIICTKQNSLGLHCIEKYRNGRASKFLVDDYILCEKEVEKRGSKGPVFAQPIKGIFMWPCILEKAWFKVKSNKRIEQNSPEEVFQTFLPLPLEKIELKLGISSKAKEKILWLHQNFSKDKGYYCKSRSNPEHDLGLLKNQYFYIMDTFKNKEKKVFFYVRNPCGFVQFRGTEISEQIRLLLEEKNINKIREGNFVLDEEEVIQQMSQITIIHHSPASKITPYKFQLDNKDDIFIGFDLKYKGVFNLSIVQTARNNSGSQSHSFYPITYQVIRLADNKLLGGHDNRDGCFGLKTAHLLDRFNQESVSGKYLIRIKKKNKEPISNISLCLIGYCQQQIKFDINAQQEFDQKWQDFMAAEGEKELSKRKNERGDKSAEIQHAVCWIGDIAYIYIKKVSRKESVTVEVNFPELMNLECISHPEIKRSQSWQSYSVRDKLFIVFQKIDLTAETQIRQYYIEAY